MNFFLTGYGVASSLIWKPICGFSGRGRRSQERAELLVNITQGAIVEKQGFINFGEALEDGGIGGKVFAHFDERTNDVKAHGDSARAVKNGGCHKGPVLRKGTDLLRELKLPQGYHSL